MAKSHRFLLILLVLLAVPDPAVAQGRGSPPGWDQGAGRREPPPFEILLRERAELRLTGEQVSRLETIGRRLEEQNRPLRQRLRRQREDFVAQRRAEIRRLSPAQRREALRRLREDRPLRDLPPEMRPVVEEIQGNTRRAMEEARTVLTPEQKERARALVRARREGARPRVLAPRLPDGGR